jgi:UDP-glucose 4-epimerase
MSVLVTGVSGQVGSAILESWVLPEGLVGMSRSRPRGGLPGVPFVRGCFHSWEDLQQLNEFKIDKVVHLAAVLAGFSEEETLLVNFFGTRTLLRYLIDRGCTKFILASSIAVAGCLDKDFLPRELPISEDHPCETSEPYGFSKALVEELTRYVHRGNPHLEFIHLRYGSIVDVRSWIPEPVRIGTSVATAFARLSRVDLQDVVQATFRALNVTRGPGVHVYNVVGPRASCDDPPQEILRSLLGERAAALDLSSYGQLHGGYAPVFAMHKIQNELGFTPAVNTQPHVVLARSRET